MLSFRDNVCVKYCKFFATCSFQSYYAITTVQYWLLYTIYLYDDKCDPV